MRFGVQFLCFYGKLYTKQLKIAHQMTCFCNLCRVYFVTLWHKFNHYK
ncbi:hypothetical protein SAMN05216354_1672 [Xylanibacter ruminicola]|uniref:Uncharacterized protein n=1 Tax=Xylanibacter ruminicola TaxID=839 RepID=A0A1H5V0T7_XYLRU|nr:hypothetical protein SAMN05216354_1672 [Xylanibacter ruminicola]SEW25744.1 hypothetical protein SAMN04487827_2386 [Prevotella sp. khp7]